MRRHEHLWGDRLPLPRVRRVDCPAGDGGPERLGRALLPGRHRAGGPAHRRSGRLHRGGAGRRPDAPRGHRIPGASAAPAGAAERAAEAPVLWRGRRRLSLSPWPRPRGGTAAVGASVTLAACSAGPVCSVSSSWRLPVTGRPRQTLRRRPRRPTPACPPRPAITPRIRPRWSRWRSATRVASIRSTRPGRRTTRGSTTGRSRAPPRPRPGLRTSRTPTASAVRRCPPWAASRRRSSPTPGRWRSTPSTSTRCSARRTSTA